MSGVDTTKEVSDSSKAFKAALLITNGVSKAGPKKTIC